MPAPNTPGARQIVRWFRRNRLPPPAVFLQVGVGVARELKIFTLAWPMTRYIGCEPNRHFLKTPWNNIGYPGLLLPVAVADYIGVGVFYERKRHRAASGLIPRVDGYHHTYDVPVTTLDSIQATYGPLTVAADGCNGSLFLWLDCEGGEEAALKGGLNVLRAASFLNIEIRLEHGDDWLAPWLTGFSLAMTHSQTSDKYDALYVRTSNE